MGRGALLQELCYLLFKTIIIRKIKIQEHEGAKKSCHLEADKTFHPERYQKQQDIIGEMFASKKMRIEDRLLVPLFANAFFLAKENVAILKYEKLKQLFSFLEVEQNSNYSNCHACTDIQSSIQSTICDKLCKELQSSKIFSMLIDSTTSPELNNLQACSYVEEINNTLQELNICQHLYFLSTDGASVVSSDKNGVNGKLKQKIPYLLANKCLAHLASLGVKDLAKEYDEIDSLNHYVYKICSVFNTKNKLDLLDVNYQLLV
ncbi:hypothetical protein ABPG72_019726 [Tetrahymena utriculariae]